VRLRVPAPLSFKWLRLKGYAAKVEGRTVSPGEALERVTAETLATLPVELEIEAVDEPGVIDAPRPRAEIEETAPNVCATQGSGSDYPATAELPAFLAPLLAGLRSADAFEVDARLRRAVRLEHHLDSQIAPLLRDVTSGQYEWKQHHASLAAFARGSDTSRRPRVLR
jgi:hypothetical protein